MDTIFTIFLLLTAVVAANIIHLIYPKIPLSIYQIVAGILMASLPTTATDFTMHPELFMMVVIAPLMFNDGQNQSFKVLSKNVKNILSLSVGFALVAVIIIGAALHLTFPRTFTLPLAFMLAAIITPTDAVAVKSLTTNVTMPENVNTTLEVESLFNDASGIVLLDLALAAFTSGAFSLTHGIWYFSYVFFGGIIFGAILGNLLISLRMKLMSQHVDIGSIVIPINVMTPVVIYWLAEECHFSGILAVVSAGVVHSILYDRLRLSSAKVQMATKMIWSIVSDALNGIVFVLLGLLIPQVIGRTTPTNLLKLIGLACGLFLVMLILRYAWARWRIVNLHSSKEKVNRDSWLLALGGVHGTITLSLAFSLPILVSGKSFAFRNSIILISALVILISIIVGAVAFPLILPRKANDYSKAEFHDALVKTVQYAITELKSNTEDRAERAIIMDQLSSQMTQYHRINTDVFEKIARKAHQLELEIIEQLAEEEKISERQAEWYSRIVARSIYNTSNHTFMSFVSTVIHRIKWRIIRHRNVKIQALHQRHLEQNQLHPDQFLSFRNVFNLLSHRVNKYLDTVQTTQNVNEITMIRRAYLQRAHFFTRDTSIDADRMNALFVEAFQLEHSYVQQSLVDGTLSQSLANALNEHISIDELVMVQSME
ncbi:MAG: sodium:proton antiporter [Limosilactobacillus sp.]|jgi:CPA1 family monovalent cation:H+ antiporter|uniref:cation:proton antiporter n=1 Tax=Limosilactobacillus sp. TaxID=2773925 RepID=UPI0025B94C27|nr:sodium:proton antiporter [Limosilactobacillus sp.]MCI1974339.1 sodium:proton antiporter [Limosilactobacillus sp.]MCI2030454.1 sodium:proton antiporter [Limosilactobacillus sp.]